MGWQRHAAGVSQHKSHSPKKLCGEKKKREANKELATRSVAREKLGSLGKEITQIDPQ
jgi:hypothetical protein